MGGETVGRGDGDGARGTCVCGGGGECNWTLDSTFFESFTSPASPEGECPCLKSVSVEAQYAFVHVLLQFVFI